ncbi:MAG: RNA methyltransferase [Clostridiales bacterium]|nr:RNA methyltransferase [Clostridiales bacterium]
MNYKGIISSRQNSLVVIARSLRNKKDRDESGLCFFEGEKLFEEAVKSGVNLKYVFSLSKNRKYCSELLKNTNCELYEVNDSVYEKITCENSPEGIFCVCNKFSREKRNTGLSMFLDGVSDPGNLGTIIRCAEAFGAEEVVTSEDSVDLYSPKTIRASMGSIFRMSVKESANLADEIDKKKSEGYKVYSSVLEDRSRTLDSIPKEDKVVFIIGNEANGISEKIKNASDGNVYIPMCNGPESLNASVAAAVIMWENRRIK